MIPFPPDKPVNSPRLPERRLDSSRLLSLARDCRDVGGPHSIRLNGIADASPKKVHDLACSRGARLCGHRVGSGSHMRGRAKPQSRRTRLLVKATEPDSRATPSNLASLLWRVSDWPCGSADFQVRRIATVGTRTAWPSSEPTPPGSRLSYPIARPARGAPPAAEGTSLRDGPIFGLAVLHMNQQEAQAQSTDRCPYERRLICETAGKSSPVLHGNARFGVQEETRQGARDREIRGPDHVLAQSAAQKLRMQVIEDVEPEPPRHTQNDSEPSCDRQVSSQL